MRVTLRTINGIHVVKAGEEERAFVDMRDALEFANNVTERNIERENVSCETEEGEDESKNG